jgi:hypothetical protein
MISKFARLALHGFPVLLRGLFEDRRTMRAGRYDAVWGERLQIIRGLRERSMARALSRVRLALEAKRTAQERYPLVVEGRLLDLPLSAAAGMIRSVVARTVLRQVKPSTSKIIETGAGWGEHLCTLYLEGGPAHATYYALEPVHLGRRCALELAALEPRFRLRAAFFDYKAPAYPVGADAMHTLLLTVHSIEQVTDIHPDTIRAALRLGREVTGVHLEPVGWQVEHESRWSPITARHAARCREMNYNRNLVPLLRSLEAEGAIRIEVLLPDFVGLEHNPGTLIVWRKL